MATFRKLIRFQVNFFLYLFIDYDIDIRNYFIGVLVAYTLKIDGILTKYKTLLNWAFIPATVISAVIHFAPALHNTFRILTPETFPLFVTGAKFLYVFYATVYIFRYFGQLERSKSEVRKVHLMDLI